MGRHQYRVQSRTAGFGVVAGQQGRDGGFRRLRVSARQVRGNGPVELGRRGADAGVAVRQRAKERRGDR